jgi:hypothetical protein
MTPNRAPNFVFKVLKDELVIGGVYIRVYNSQPKMKLPAPSDILKDLFAYNPNLVPYSEEIFFLCLFSSILYVSSNSICPFHIYLIIPVLF